MITIVLPVYNEEQVLKANTLALFGYCEKEINQDWQIVISENGSNDKTPDIFTFDEIIALQKKADGEGWSFTVG